MTASPSLLGDNFRFPLTGVGIAVSVLGALAYLAGWQLGWIEAMVLAAGCWFALAVAIPFVVGRLKLDVTRHLEPNRVTVGNRAVAALRVSNPGKSPSGRRVVEETLGDSRLAVDVPVLGPGGEIESIFPLPTDKRGQIVVGPTIIGRADPLGLMRREVAQTGTDVLWVHPRVVALKPLPVGFAKDLEGPTSDASPAGDVAFHTIREYEPGDDYRHIHWLSTARTGQLMIRHYVDNRRPHITVVLDTQLDRYGENEFEVAVGIAASLGLSGLLHEQPISVIEPTSVLLGPGVSRSRNDFLDRMTLVATEEEVDLRSTALTALRIDQGSSAVVIITGGVEAASLLMVTKAVSRRARPIVVRVWPDGEVQPGVLPGAKLLDVSSLEMLKIGWDRMAV